MFWWLEQHLLKTGSVKPTVLLNAGCPQTWQTPANEDTIIAALEWESWRSSHNSKWKLGLSQLTVLEVYFLVINYISTSTCCLRMCFQKIVLYEYVCSFANGCNSTHCRWARLTQMFCGLMKSFTGEVVSNAHSSHFWAWNNPHAVCEVGYQVHFGFCIWAVIVRDIVGPYLLPDRLTAQWYCGFLETVPLGLLEDVPLGLGQGLWFHHDGAPTLYGDVQQWLNVTCPGRWIRHSGPIAWPSCSLDLIFMHSFLWGHVKEQICAALPGLSKISWQYFKQLWQQSVPAC